jgi:murein DD-endopeptidase MepM/ murein hydrolase activator NlpD
MHMVKKGDTLAKIAKTYGAKSDEIIAFNNLDEDGKDLRVGERIMVPGGTKPTIAKPKTTLATTYDVIRPSSSRQSPSASGFVWPAGVRTITQYFHWRHNGMDIAGPFETAIYAAKAGTVAISQCGWNGGYGCYVVINHGGGVKTVYGHNSRLLVSVGEYVETGQTIALMGNTGNVRGRTGIHLHFEVQINGARVNPLGYVR